MQELEVELMHANFEPVSSTPKAKDIWLNADWKGYFDFSTTITAKYLDEKDDAKWVSNHVNDESTQIKSLDKNKTTDWIHNDEVMNPNQLVNDPEDKNMSIDSSDNIEDELQRSSEDDNRKSLSSSQKQKEDVNNKIILRAIRRFYQSIYKDDNVMHIRKRFRNVTSAEFYQGIEDLLKTYILPNKDDMSTIQVSPTWLDDTHEDFWSLAVFLFRFIGFKPKDNLKYNKDIEQKGQQMQSCLYNYSHPKMLKILDLSEFQILFEYAYTFHLDEILDDNKTLRVNKRTYRLVFDRMHELLQRRVAKQQAN